MAWDFREQWNNESEEYSIRLFVIVWFVSILVPPGVEFLRKYRARDSPWPAVDLRFCLWLLVFKYWTGRSDLSSSLSVLITCISSVNQWVRESFFLKNSSQRSVVGGPRCNSWAALLVEVSEHKLEASQTRIVTGFLPSFIRFAKCYSWTDSSFLVTRIFCKDYKNQSRVWFSLKSASRRNCE